MSRVYDFLLLAHILAAFALLAMVVMYTAFVLGDPAPRPAVLLAQTLDGIGGVGTLVFGVWLALYVDGYEVWDGWIVAALVLWAAAAETGRRTHAALEPVLSGGPGAGASAVDRAAVRWHVIRTALIVLLLADMIFKPGS
jgi:hypothetical protein